MKIEPLQNGFVVRVKGKRAFFAESIDNLDMDGLIKEEEKLAGDEGMSGPRRDNLLAEALPLGIMGLMDAIRGRMESFPVGAPKPTNEVPKRTHYLKCDPTVFTLASEGLKSWEIRLNDRDFKPGDHIQLLQTKYSRAAMDRGAPLDYTGRTLDGKIVFIMRGPKYGLMEGWVIMSVEWDLDNQ